MSVFVMTVVVTAVLFLGAAAAAVIYRWACDRAERKATYLERKATDAYLDRALADAARNGRRARYSGLSWA